MNAPIYAVFSGVPGTAELRWNGADFGEAWRLAISNAKEEPMVALRALPPEWQWTKTVFRWEDLPGKQVLRVFRVEATSDPLGGIIPKSASGSSEPEE